MIIILKNTGNTSLRFASPNEFSAGGLQFSQNTINIDIAKKYDVWSGINVAFGAEHRYENFKITAGEEASYATYDVNGNVWNNTTQRPTDFFGNALAGGSQVFAGFRPENAVDKKQTISCRICRYRTEFYRLAFGRCGSEIRKIIQILVLRSIIN